ncbi:acetylcholinesterase-like [Pollicipes pollicipes]|uniref:acetylcholinesterase-like n=2 Tax=Pollicipes pollicipes TaxID=41117 RepID=UPI0018855527|nr:acetylcholinesterase-like [Pollicipes pollicipes]
MRRPWWRLPLALCLLALAGYAAGVEDKPLTDLLREMNQKRNRSGTASDARGHPPYSRDPLIVETRDGLVRGFRKEVFGKSLDVFYGIPFAEPPVGELRFKKPIPVAPWEGVYNATTLPNTCPQETFSYFPGFRGEEMWNPNTPLSEDCLYLNIWVPSVFRQPVTPKTEVLVWIYGGGFMSGTSTLEVYDADILSIESNLIVASMQYRVGAFGFLYLGHPEAPGNVGLFDQSLALKWLKDNIAFFGGKPESLTIFGESAGAASVSVHFLSPYSREYVSRGIMQSGTINAPWSIMTKEKAFRVGSTLVDDCGCNASRITDQMDAVIECMRTVPWQDLSAKQWNSYGGILDFPSAPTIDGDFLPKHPIDMLKEGDFRHTELLLGSNKDEGTYFILYDFIQFFKKDDPSFLERSKFLEIIEAIFGSWEEMEKLAIIFQYTDWDHIDDGYLNQKMLGDVVGDYYFVCPTNYFAQSFAAQGMNVYYYFFTQRTSLNPWGDWMGVMHGDEIDYVLGNPINQSLHYTAAEANLSRRIIEHYANFIRTGSPVREGVSWPIYSRNQPQYYIFDGRVRGLGNGPRATGCAFWNEMMPSLRETLQRPQPGRGLLRRRPSAGEAALSAWWAVPWIVSLIAFMA